MPELPEVETLKRELNRVLPGQKIKSAQVHWPKAVAPLRVPEFEKRISDTTIAAILRRAKIIILDLKGPLSLAIHLKMTGQLIYHRKKGRDLVGGHPDPGYEEIVPNKHTRLTFEFRDGSKLYFNDQRKFGWVRLVNDSELKDLTGEIGVEPLSKLFTAELLSDLFARYPNRTIKQILMDQKLIAGIGNIYADESAFLAKLRPDRRARTLTKAQIGVLTEKIVEVLKASIKLKGTSSRNYRRSDGSRGGFVPRLFVYGRAGQACKICGTKILKTRHHGRGTSFCPHCQR